MKRLRITKEQFNRSNYFQRKYGKLEYVSESGKLYKTNKGNVLKFKESSDGGKARIERLCANLEKQYDTLTYDEIERKLKEAGFVLDEYGGKTNAYAVFVHDCGIVVNMEYRFVKNYGTRDSWHAADVTYFGWYDDPEYQRWSNESTKKFGKKFNESSFQVLDSDGETTTLSRECPFCHKEHHITIDIGEDEFYDRYDAMKAGELIQRAFPMLDPSQREFIKTGICDDCWDSI